MLLHAFGAGCASPFASNALQAAIWAQPGIAALVCLGRGDKGGAARALAGCTTADQARIAATFTARSDSDSCGRGSSAPVTSRMDRVSLTTHEVRWP